MSTWKYEQYGDEHPRCRRFHGVIFKSAPGSYNTVIADGMMHSERDCMRMAEEFLSQPITEDYWKKIRNCVPIDANSYNEFIAKMKAIYGEKLTRGMILGKHHYYDGGDMVSIKECNFWVINNAT